MKKNSAYPVPAASPTAHHVLSFKLSGKIAKKVTPKSVPAARLISAQSGLCANRSDVLIDPPTRAKAYAATTCHKVICSFKRLRTIRDLRDSAASRSSDEPTVRAREGGSDNDPNF